MTWIWIRDSNSYSIIKRICKAELEVSWWNYTMLSTLEVAASFGRLSPDIAISSCGPAGHRLGGFYQTVLKLLNAGLLQTGIDAH